MKNLLTSWVLMALAVCSGCGSDAVFSPKDQLSLDVQRIKDYLKKENMVAQVHPASKIHYGVTKQGSGPKATFGSSVKVKYRGFLLSNKEFDKGSLTFVLGRGDVIRGWDVALRLFNKGTKVTIFIPSALAYGNTPGPNPRSRLPLNSVLAFELTVEDIRSY